MSLATLRTKRSFGEIFNDGIGFLRANFKPMAKILIYLIMPAVFIAAMIIGYSTTVFFDIPILPILLYLAIFLTIYAMINLVVFTYVEDHYQGIVHTTGSMWRAISPRIIGVVLNTFVLSLLMGILFFLLSSLNVFLVQFIGRFTLILEIAARVLLLPAYIASSIIILERVGAGTAITRAYYLFNGKWWYSIKFIIASFIMTFAIAAFFGVLAVLIMDSLGLLNTNVETSWIMVTLGIIFSFLTPLVISVAVMPGLCVLAFYYYSLVEEKDFSGLYDRINTLTLDVDEPENPDARPDDRPDISFDPEADF